jgi:hypothetical protein
MDHKVQHFQVFPEVSIVSSGYIEKEQAYQYAAGPPYYLATTARDI